MSNNNCEIHSSGVQNSSKHVYAFLLHIGTDPHTPVLQQLQNYFLYIHFVLFIKLFSSPVSRKTAIETI